ncbi:hypothetical protein E2493_13285 [Sphingomonas parva]|uniref:Uncharacterized protein n=1 Tax=Sphingomonas parva TaxID=2555898 RepID=A0A4Y8ZPA0_9SPHN|nr:hypothetical protein [Sphingomonas parva]TFI57794.1 hypothetical protein E2493_13285 [Sphingomonas parva]
MPSDLHFLIRNALTGIVFLICCIAGTVIYLAMASSCTLLCIVSAPAPPRDVEIFRQLLARAGDASWLAIGISPIIGVVVQGLVLTSRRTAYETASREKGAHFDDYARLIVGDHIRKTMKDKQRTLQFHSGTKEFSSVFEPVRDDDSLFVWAYYSNAPPHLIEWARRRRSYGYIGVNWLAASVLGLATGMLLFPILTASAAIQILLFTLAVALLFAIALKMAKEMKRDACRMELMWAYAFIHKDVTEELAVRTGGAFAAAGPGPAAATTPAPAARPRGLWRLFTRRG